MAVAAVDPAGDGFGDSAYDGFGEVDAEAQVLADYPKVLFRIA